MSALDVEYYRRRLEEELEMVGRAENEAIRAIHQELASLYEKMIKALEGPATEVA